MKVRMLAKAHQIRQQTGVIQCRTTIFDHHSAPVRLAGDRAVGFEQMAVDAFFDYLGIVALEQFRARLRVITDRDVQAINAHTRQNAYTISLNFIQTAYAHADRLAGSG